MGRYVVLSTTSKKVKVGDSMAPEKKVEPVVVEEPPKKKVAKKKVEEVTATGLKPAPVPSKPKKWGLS